MMKNVLVITNKIDLTVDYLISKYRNEVNFFRLNTDCFHDYNISIKNRDIIIEYMDKSSNISISECDSLYYRKISFPTLEEYPLKYRELMRKEMQNIIDGIAERIGNIALTKPSILRRADNKVLQLLLAQELGFNIPESLITNSNSAAMEFINTYDSIIKPISIGKIINEGTLEVIQTNSINKNIAIDGLSNSPAYFQKYQVKDYEVRLTIVNKKLFAVRIDSSNKIDWRKKDAKLKYSNIKIPKDISIKCLVMMEKLELKFAAFDFIVKDNEFIFLELNANGQWLWLEEELNLGIDKAIIKILKGET